MNNEERQLINNSITHWKKDAIDPFDKGFYLNVEHFRWFQYMQDDIECKLDRENCSLCATYYKYGFKDKCSNCLWYLYAEKECSELGQEYTNFMNNSTKENAKEVIEKLWRIGTNA